MDILSFLKDAEEHGFCLTTKAGRLMGDVHFTLTEIAPDPETPTLPMVLQWAAPVGSEKYPTAAWYVSVWHDLSGKRNGGYGHTGVDLNVDRAPYGDVDRGEPVYAVAAGEIIAAAYHPSYLGGVVYRVRYDAPARDYAAYRMEDGLPLMQSVTLEPGTWLYIRCWHLADDAVFRAWQAGGMVGQGALLGSIGNYQAGDTGDHCHLDMALQPFGVDWWFTRHSEIQWLDPLPVLAMHLGADVVDLMKWKGQG